MLSAVPAIAMALQQTTTLRVGSRVFCNDYRNPVVLAKEAATMDYLSEGRLEFGIGAGWIGKEYEAVGLPFDEFPERFARMAETVEAYKAFMGGEPLELAGQSIQWSGFHGIPAPAQRPHPPAVGTLPRAGTLSLTPSLSLPYPALPRAGTLSLTPSLSLPYPALPRAGPQPHSTLTLTLVLALAQAMALTRTLALALSK